MEITWNCRLLSHCMLYTRRKKKNNKTLFLFFCFFSLSVAYNFGSVIIDCSSMLINTAEKWVLKTTMYLSTRTHKHIYAYIQFYMYVRTRTCFVLKICFYGHVFNFPRFNCCFPINIVYEVYSFFSSSSPSSTLFFSFSYEITTM